MANARSGPVPGRRGSAIEGPMSALETNNRMLLTTNTWAGRLHESTHGFRS